MIIKSIYFALCFAGSFLGLIIMLHIPSLFWIGLGMFILFIIKFFLMLPQYKEE